MVDENSTIPVVAPMHCLGETAALQRPSIIIARLIGALACAAGAAQPAHAATATASVSANNVKPLVLSKVQDLSFGTITLGPGVWSNATVSISQAGVLACNPNVTCTGAVAAATYNAQGSNQQTVHINCPNFILTSQTDPTQTLVMTTNAPASIVLPNSGSPGLNFSIGGSVTLNSTTSGGTYVGTFNVTADYQ
jgi:spore coat protein U-like protein